MSIIDCVFILQSVICKVLNTGGKLHTSFIDYERCFDSIDRNVLWYKLLAVHSRMVIALHAMYVTVKPCVLLNSEYSPFVFRVTTGGKTGRSVFTDVLQLLN